MASTSPFPSLPRHSNCQKKSTANPYDILQKFQKEKIERPLKKHWYEKSKEEQLAEVTVMVSTINEEVLIIWAESVSKALDMAIEAIEAVDVVDQLEYGKNNNSQSSQSQIKVTKRILIAKVKEANDARKKTSSNEVKQLRDLTQPFLI